MKKIITLFFIFCFTLVGQAQVSKTINITTAGTLSTALTAGELNTVTNLIITGTIDARDFTTMRDNMPVLANLDLSGTTIVAYSGTAGPAGVKTSASNAKNMAIESDVDNLLSIMHPQQIKQLEKATATTVYPANEIPEFAFCTPTYIGKVSLKSVIMPNSVTSIGSQAFESCTGLSIVTLPSSITSIGSEAFEFCSELSSITIPGSVTSIGNYAFWYCNGLTEFIVDASNLNYSSQNGVLFNKNVSQLIQCPSKKQGTYSMPSSVTSIASYAFLSCTELSSVTISGSVTLIGDYAFNNCTGLSNITIPGSVTSIGNGTFINCVGLTEFIVDVTNLNYSSQNGVLFNKNATLLIQYPCVKQGVYTIPSSVTSIGSYAFQYCIGLSNITIPGSVTSMGRNAFYSCTGLSSVTLPGSVTSIGSYTFYGCTGLTSIYAYPSTPVNLSNTNLVFYNVNTSTCTLYVPTGSKAAYQAAVQWKDFTNIAEKDFSVSKTIQVTNAGTLSSLLTTNELNAVTNLTITGTIDARDFKTMRDNMPALAVLDISSVAIVTYTGTAGTYSSSNITYPASTIPDYAFSIPISYAGKKSLISIILPSSITAIGNTTFENCSNLTGTLTIPSNVTSIGNYAFYGCSQLTGLAIPNGATSIGIYAFYSCYQLTGLSIPNSVVSIGNCAFQACNALTGSLSIPASVTSIGILAFCGTNYTTVTIPNSVTSIGSRAFIGCNALSNIIVDAGNLNYSSLNGSLFNKDQSTLIQCPAGKQGSYVIPGTVKSLGEYAIINCTKLTSVTLPSSLSTIALYAFYGCYGLNTISIPATVLWLDNYALAYCTNLISIYVNSNPPIVTSTTFNNINKTTCTLYVPTGSKSAYQAADQWKDFINIVEFATALPTVTNESINIYPNPVVDNFRIDGLEGKTLLQLTDLSGKVLLQKQVIGDENVSLSEFPSGMYMIKLSNNGVNYQKKLVKK